MIFSCSSNIVHVVHDRWIKKPRLAPINDGCLIIIDLQLQDIFLDSFGSDPEKLIYATSLLFTS